MSGQTQQPGDEQCSNVNFNPPILQESALTEQVASNRQASESSQFSMPANNNLQSSTGQNILQPSTNISSSNRIEKVLYLPVKLNNNLINAFLDTGANNNFIRPDAVPNGAEYIPIVEYVKTAFKTTDSKTLITRACYLDTEIDGKTYKLYYMVNEQLDTMITLGLTWMEDYRVILNFATGTITFDDRTLNLTRIC